MQWEDKFILISPLDYLYELCGLRWNCGACRWDHIWLCMYVPVDDQAEITNLWHQPVSYMF